MLFSKDGKEWTAPKTVLDPGDWLWRVTWHQGVCYGVSYNNRVRRTPPTTVPTDAGKASADTTDWELKLVSSTDGENFTPVAQLDVPGSPNETTLRFLADGRMAALVRREGGDMTGWVGTSKTPYTQWSWKPLPQRVGGPNFIQLPDGRLIAVTRKYASGAKTVLSWLDVDKGTLDDILTFPSGGDTSYAGMVWHGGLLWVSYYSSHEQNKASIYLAKVKLSSVEEKPGTP